VVLQAEPEHCSGLRQHACSQSILAAGWLGGRIAVEMQQKTDAAITGPWHIPNQLQKIPTWDPPADKQARRGISHSISHSAAAHRAFDRADQALGTPSAVRRPDNSCCCADVPPPLERGFPKPLEGNGSPSRAA